jgi:protein CpxP
MTITSETREQIVSELKRFSNDLNLSDQQKEQLHSALSDSREIVEEYLKTNPHISRANIVSIVKAHREEISRRVATFLTADQLTKWNSEVAKAKEFLGQKIEG